MRRALAASAAALLLATAATPACAQAPEQLEQLEPDGGVWQLEYYGIASRGEADGHSFQLLYGVTDRLALGVEIESDGFAPTALYRFTDPEGDPIGIGVEVQAELDGDFELASVEGRLILEKRTPGWWAQGNAILRHARENGGWSTAPAYGWTVSRALAQGLWLGAEGSGQAGADAGHFLGPAVTAEFEPGGGSEIELGLAYLRRVSGAGPADSVRIFVQLNL